MKLFYQYPQPDAKKIHEMVSKGFRIEHPERVNGYEGMFLFHVPDVYVSDEISQRIEGNPELSDNLIEMLKRFCNDDYGFVTQDERNNNGETRYIAASSSWMIGRYASKYYSVVFETLFDISLFYFVEEEISSIWQQQDKKCDEYRDPKFQNGKPRDRGNQLHYVP